MSSAKQLISTVAAILLLLQVHTTNAETTSYPSDFSLESLAKQLSKDLERAGLKSDVERIDESRAPGRTQGSGSESTQSTQPKLSTQLPDDLIWLAAAAGDEQGEVLGFFDRVSRRDRPEILSIYFRQQGTKAQWYFVNNGTAPIECLTIGHRMYQYPRGRGAQTEVKNCAANIAPGDYHLLSETYFPPEWPADEPISRVRLLDLEFKYRGKSSGYLRGQLIASYEGGGGVGLEQRKRELKSHNAR